jgi:hypothetical protein
VTGGEQRRLVDEVGEVGAGEAGGAPGEHLEVDVVGERLAAAWIFRMASRPFEVGAVDDDLAVEAAGAQQRRVEDVGAVGRRDQDDAGALTSKPSISTSSWLSVCSRSSCPPPMPAPRWRPTASISSMKMMAGALALACSNRSRTRRGADTDEHLDEVGAGDREERHAGLAGDRAGEQGLAGPGRAEQQHALGDLGAQRLELLRVLEELLDLAELLDRLVGAGDVGEGDLRRVLG